MKHVNAILATAFLLVPLTSCKIAPLTNTALPREDVVQEPPQIPPIPAPSAQALQLPQGYTAEVVVRDLTYPSTVTVAKDGTLYFAESGYVYGDASAPARIWRVTPSGELSLFASEGLGGPITDLLLHDGRLYASHRGKVSVVTAGAVQDLVAGLPSQGDHFNNQLAVGPDGLIYMGQGTVTNSGVVGIDNWAMGWLKRYPRLHDTPARSIDLAGTEFVSLNPMTLTVGEEAPVAATGAFQPFGDSGAERIAGSIKANGTILRFSPDGSDLEVYAWGLRNPYGLTWSANGELFVAENGFDDRGSRPIDNAPDTLWKIRQGAWYGWPDFASGVPVTDPRFQPAEKPAVGMLMAKHPPVEKPFLTRPPHSAVTQLALSTSRDFGHAGQLFLAEFGHMAPLTGTVDKPVGFGVYRVDLNRREVTPFIRTRADALGPAGMEHVATAGLKRPVDVAFTPTGETLYIADIGAFAVPPTVAPMPMPMEATGVIWRVYRTGTQPVGPPPGLTPLPPKAAANP